MKIIKRLITVGFICVLCVGVTACEKKVGGDLATNEAGNWTQVAPTKDMDEFYNNPEDVIISIDDEDDTDFDIELNTGNEENDNSEDANKEEITQSANATILMVGDMLLHAAVSESGIKEDGTYNYDHFFKYVKDDISSADMAIVNQEVILGGEELGISGYPTFNSVYEVADAVANAGFDVVLHATNHTLDKGMKGFDNCMNYWKENYPEISVTGANQSQEEQDKICVRNLNGIDVAILNYTYGTNGIPLPKDKPYVVNLLDEEQIRSDVAKAKEATDFVMVCPHWGTEYVLEETAEQKKWVDLFLELEVDLVIGTHPHVIEPVKWYENEDGHKMLVYYSLGNFINSTGSTQKNVGWRYVGAMAKVDIERGEDGEVFIKDYDADPLVTHVESGYGNITTFKLEDYSDEMIKKSKSKQKQSDFSIEYCEKLWEKVFGDL